MSDSSPAIVPSEPAANEFELFKQGESISLALYYGIGFECSRTGIAKNYEREFEFSFDVEVDPRAVERRMSIDTHPMPEEWREANR